jgi:hypothetical protein
MEPSGIISEFEFVESRIIDSGLFKDLNFYICSND